MHRDYLNLVPAHAGLSAEDKRRLTAAVPVSYAEYLGETVIHEWGHTLTVEKVGNYVRGGFDWGQHLPADLLQEIRTAIQASGVRVDNYEVGEVIAEDVRRFHSGFFSELNYRTDRHDGWDLQKAWERAGKIWGWLSAP